jgi:hypothetical protein
MRITFRVVQRVGGDDPALNHVGDGQLAEVRLVELDANHQPAPAHLLDEVGIFGLHLTQPAQEFLADTLGVLHEPLLLDDLQRCQPCGAGEFVAAEGAGVQQRVFAEHLVPQRRARREGADGHHAAAQRLGKRHDVGAHARMLHAPQLARASQSRLHLVHNQHGVVAVAQFAQAGQVIVGWDADAALALNRLDDDACGLLVEVRGDGVGVAERHMHKAWQQRVERLAVHFAPAGGEAAHRLAVIAAHSANHLHAPSRLTGEFNRALYRLCARIAEKAILQVAGQHFRQFRCQPCLRRVEHDLAGHRHHVQLAFDRLHNLRMAVSQREHAVPAKAVQKLASLRVPDIAPFGVPLHAQPREAQHLRQSGVQVTLGQLGNLVGKRFGIRRKLSHRIIAPCGGLYLTRLGVQATRRRNQDYGAWYNQIAMSVIADRVRELVAALPENLQQQILEYVSQLSQTAPRGIPGDDFQAIAGLLSDEDAEAILSAIEHDCEQICPNEW